MFIHLTGMSPRTASQRARERITFAGLLERALQVEGHTVNRNPYLDEVPEPDLTVVGVTSALSPGATYALAGLEAIGRAVGQGLPLLLFVDDPMLTKTKAAAKSVLRDPDRLWTDYLLSKRIRESRTLDQRQKRRIHNAAQILAGECWPPVLVPMHQWGAVDELMGILVPKRLGIVTDVIPLDVTAVLGLNLDVGGSPRETQAEIWVTDSHYSKDTLKPDRVRWPVVPVNSASMDSPRQVYATARGVHQGLASGCPGWWTPTPLYAAQAGAAYLMDQAEQNLTGSLSPYYITADDVEAVGRTGHRMLVGQQRAYLKETSWSLDDLLSRLVDVIGSTSSFVPPDTSALPSGTS